MKKKNTRVPQWLTCGFVLTGLAAGGLLLRAMQASPNGTSRRTEPQRRITLGAAEPASLYAVTIAIKNPEQIQGNRQVRVAIADARGKIAEKVLHTADLDFYLTLRPRVPGQVSVTLSAPAAEPLPELETTMRRIPTEPGDPSVIAAAPNDTWQAAQPVEFGQTVFGGGDERPYAPAPSEDQYSEMLKGFQWFRFTFHGTEPKLAYFVLDITDREVPLDVDIFQSGKNAKGQPDVVPYTDGAAIYQIEATQNYPGLYKFRTRILKPGETYYVRVDANHPAYQLHMYDYAVPPYRDPRQAVRTGMDFLINMGDTWLSNTPRRGAVGLRTTMVHSDTQLCIACHPTQFTTRGYMTAVANGYPPTQRPALEFLTDRIYNNQRPLYGEPGTDWVRVIYSARTVASRLPVIEHLFEQNVTHDPPRLSFNVPYGNFLKIHYQDRTAMPGDESDGCEPSISPFEIAAQSWETFQILYQQTREEQWAAERDLVERLAIPREPKNMIDLNWKIHFLATIGREKYRTQLDQLLDQLYSFQQPGGMWPYTFDKNAKPADFISYHAVLAAALAGRRPETDTHLARAVDALLKAQRPEGSWEGDPVYQGFNTPFRATQFAVMALSTLYPGPNRKPAKEKGWDDAFPPVPERLAGHDLPRLLSQLDQLWDLAPEPVLRQVRAILESSDQPLAREAAARAMGHMADSGATKALIAALGDSNKMVQRTAGWALRMILERRPDATTEGRAELAAALVSSNARTRWGATQVFNQHFKYLAGDTRLGLALRRDLDDPVPAVRLNAARGLWQWYYWTVDDHDARIGIIEALATRLNTETDPMVRRAVQESLYDALDENTGYLAAWIEAASAKDDQDKINDGYEAVVRDQAQALSKVLGSATPLGREGILGALWDFHVRHYSLPQLKTNTVSISLPAVFTKYVSGVPDLHRQGYEYPPYRETVDFRYDVHNGFYQTRIGNDSDLIHFFPSSGRELEAALIACLSGADSNTKINVLKAGSTLSGAGGQRFAEAALQLALDPDQQVRDTVRYVYENGQRGVLNIDAPAVPSPALVKTIAEILARGDLDAQAVALPLLSGLPADSAWTRQLAILSAVRSLLDAQPRVKNYAQVLAAAGSFPELMQDSRRRSQTIEAFQDQDPDVQRAAIQITLERFLDDVDMQTLLGTTFDRLGSSQRNILIEEVSDPKFMRRHLGVSGGAVSQDRSYVLGNGKYLYKAPDFLNHPVVFRAVMASLGDRDANVRAAALDLLRKVQGIELRPDFRAALDRLRNDPNQRLQLIANRVLSGKNLKEALADVEPGSVLDFRFFVSKIEPILAAPGADGKACVVCHATHVIFKLRPPNTDGQFSPQDSEENYKYAMRVLDISDPNHSLILIKPTRPTDAAGDVDDYLATHNGGQRWPGNESSQQYKTILAWIRGARIEASSPGAHILQKR
ncbi:MAG TPA: HEAT repeat domain-containing protein [Bryobacteraceae bacterium]|nr:HEAT repeat domain-containing protein [Bryobacteraceae bacterium]